MAPEGEPPPAPPPGPSIEEIGAQELATVPPAGITYGETERWIVVNTATQRAVAFEGAKPVRVALAARLACPVGSRPGEYHVYARVENETMDSTSLGFPSRWA